MGFMDLFNGKQQQNQPASQPNPQGGNSGSPNLGGDKNIQAGDQPNSGALESAKKGKEASPLDPYTKLWETGGVDSSAGEGGKPATPTTPAAPAKTNYSELAKKLDFGRLIPQELAAKALAGDVPSFIKIISGVSQASAAASMQMAEEISSRTGKSMEEKWNSSLPGKFKELSLSDRNLKNPALSHPAVKPLIDATKAQFALKYPEATSDELLKMAEDYVTGVVTEIQSKDPSKQTVEKTGTNSSDLNERRAQQESGNFDWFEHYGIKPLS